MRGNMSIWLLVLAPCLSSGVLLDSHQAAIGDGTLNSTDPCGGFNRNRCSAKMGCAWMDGCKIRMAWLNIMKVGGSFATTLAHWVNSSLPDQEHVPSMHQIANHEDMSRNVHTMSMRYKFPAGPSFVNVFNGVQTQLNHMPIMQDEWEDWRRNWMGIFREPASRTLSSYNHFSRGKVDLFTFARSIVGQQASMLSTGERGIDLINCEFAATASGNACRNAQEPSVALAIQRLHGFAFVGILEEFDASVCLFHKMFGSKCLAVEFENTRKGTYPANGAKNNFLLAELRKQRDPWDIPVYEAATRRFWSDVHKYNLRPSECKQMCPGAAKFEGAQPGPNDVFKPSSS